MAVVYKGIGTHVARLAGEHQEMDRVAGVLLKLALANAERHRLTGNYIRNLHVRDDVRRKGVRDRLVVAGDKAAISIEYGHARRLDNDDPTQSDFYWVPGQFILTDAINSIPGHSYTDTVWGRAFR